MKQNERNANVFRSAGVRSTERSVGIMCVPRKTKSCCKQGLQAEACPCDTQKHEQVAILQSKMSGLRMFLGARECEARSNP